MLDTATRLASPWPGWASEPGAGLASIPPTKPASRRRIQAATSLCRGPSDRSWQVLTDHQDWGAAPLVLPPDPGAWYQLAAAGGWQAAIADTTHAAAHDVVAARHAGRTSLTAAWCSLPVSVPVLCAAATGHGVQALQTAVRIAAAEGLPLQYTVVVLVSLAEGRPTATVRAAATMLQSHVSAVVTVLADVGLRSQAFAASDRLRGAPLETADRLAQAVLASAHRQWGDPLPPAPVPAVLPADQVPPTHVYAEGVHRP
ncbi:hypothetical protein ITX44_19725 [Streptomyces sp. KK5PA1]|uniref:Uncharacterized protein n=1 Tax=Actinacidiphila acididurans TaxID=2784346 RepID=A0ABS2TTS5_9ACTN|nr:hypothetical protein [Actinacidiphila acididurans]